MKIAVIGSGAMGCFFGSLLSVQNDISIFGRNKNTIDFINSNGISVNEKIFLPMGINKYSWKNLGEYCAGATGLELLHDDFHKLAQMFFEDGEFNKKQIVPQNWILEMKNTQFDCQDYYKKERFIPKISAGYFVWQSRDGIVFRDGADGQYIICDKKNNLLITIMSTEKDMAKVTECLRGII